MDIIQCSHNYSLYAKEWVREKTTSSIEPKKVFEKDKLNEPIFAAFTPSLVECELFPQFVCLI